jgi:4-amino-4-deoxy-L-arabinose transferase-like glycosyltransferase
MLIAFGLRLAFALAQDHRLPYSGTSGDSAWYLRSALQIVTDRLPGPVPTAPLYLVFIGLAQVFLPPEAAIIAIRLLQVLMGTATCYFAYRLALLVSGDERAGLIAAGVLAVSPAFIIETGQILTETVYIFLVTAALLIYVSRYSLAQGWIRPIIIVALLLGLATMTRAVLLLFPLGLVVHLIIVSGWRDSLKRAAVLLTVYCLLMSVWTVYNKARWDRLVIGAEGMFAFLYVGATGWQDPYVLDEQLMEDAPGLSEAQELDTPTRQQAYSEAASEAILGDPLGWLRRRLTETANAYLQPHGTVFFPGESLKEIAVDWLRADRSLGGLLDLTRGDAFWPKLILYIFHYAGILLGAVGMWLSRKQWRTTLPLIGFILYTTLVHLPLLALPRYIFPTEVFWWVFAGIAISSQLAAFSKKRIIPVETRLMETARH